MFRPIPVHITRRRGFSLVLSLTVMAMLLLLCISIAALMSVELRAARASVAQSRARLNALMGARIALGELQRLVGPDQRVTATADILGNPEAVPYAKSNPTKPDYYVSPGGESVMHPRWVGVWNSGRGPATPVAAESSPAPGEETRVIQRTVDGYLADSRFSAGKDWQTDRASSDPRRASPRLLGWLVSGADTVRAQGEPVTPFTRVNPTAGDVELVGAGTLGSLYNAFASTGSDGYRVHARAVPIPGVGDETHGRYAYWVSDEGVKARINVADKFEGKAPGADNLTGGGMYRLLMSQRFDFTAVRSAIDGVAHLPEFLQFVTDHRAERGWRAVSEFDDIALMDGAADVAPVRAHHFHDVTFDSAGVFADVVNGGLRKDLTAFLNAGAAGIPDQEGVPGSGILASAPILQGEAHKVISPTFRLLKDWWSVAPTGVADRGNLVGIVSPETQPATYDNLRSMQYWSNRTGVTMTLGLPVYAGYSAPGRATPRAPLTPVMTAFDHHYSAGLEPVAGGAKGLQRYNKFFAIQPTVTLWNPYSVPIRLDNGLRVALLTCIQPRFKLMTLNAKGGYSTRAQTSIRPVRWYHLGGLKTLEPGQAVTFIARGGQRFSDTPSPEPIHDDVEMIPGVPNRGAYYVDRATDTGGVESTDLDPAKLDLIKIGYYRCSLFERRDSHAGDPANHFFAAGYNEFADAGPMAQVMLVTDDKKTVLQQVSLDPWTRLVNQDGGGAPILANNRHGSNDGIGVKELIGAAAAAAQTDDQLHMGFRFLRLDDDADSGDSSAGARRCVNLNPLVNLNFRATRHTRHPYDTPSLTRSDNHFDYGMITSDHSLDFDDVNLYPGCAATASSPWLSGVRAGAAARFAVVDVPRAALGIHSIGYLQHAPLLPMPWAPGFPVGNSFPPLSPNDSPRSLARTGYSAAEEDKLWAEVNPTDAYGHYARQFSGGTAPWKGDYALNGQRLLSDWSYELNHALWDGYLFSGIPAANTGWTDPLCRWELGSVSGPDVVPNSRLIPSGYAPPHDYAGAGADRNSAAYRVSASLMQAGAFNVNSTSVPAWQALLSSFRNLPVPTRNGGASAVGNAFPRLTVPVNGATSGKPYDNTTWSGYRSLSDDEIRTLAEKIVAEVKRRGPFLSMGDFVNRRLVAPTDTGNWNERENDYLGVLQAAINRAGINDALSADSAFAIDRETADTLPERATSPVPNPKSKVRDKLAGAPGYLLQSDVLQKLGSVLTVRSDTFRIRARGESEDGASAVVELVVQRTPEPLAPASVADGGLPVNPRAVSATKSPAHAGNQFFGRRMTVVSTRWLAETDI